MTAAQKKQLLATAVKAAHAAGDIMRRNRLALKKINEVTQRDIKLELDVRCQRKIESILTRTHPEIGILGEEENVGDIETELRWVVDPIDGTVNFTYGIPHACVSIALQRRLAKRNQYGDDYETVVGAVFDPFTDELWTAIRGQVAKLNAGMWGCADDADTVTTTLPWTSLTGVPQDIADGDNDSLAGISCNTGQILGWDGQAWGCADDNGLSDPFCVVIVVGANE